VRTRDETFDEFVVASATRLLRSAFALTGDRAAAEDVVQDVLERLYIAWPRVDDPLAYCRRALINRSTNRWRNRRRHPEISLTDSHDRATTDVAAQSDDRDALMRAIAILPPRQRAVVVLRYLDDLSETDSARLLGCSVGTVKSQTARALARLREVLATADQPAESRSTT
jgi:RNA polymerase sigma-70 factor (sigma-E family)